MTRKLAIVLAAVGALGAAALVPTVASAKHKHHHHHHKYWGYGGFYGPAYYAGPSCYTVKRIVYTINGPRVRRIMVCD